MQKNYEIRRTLQTIGNSTFIKYYHEFKNHSLNSLNIDFIELFRNETWSKKSFHPKINSGQKIFRNNWQQVALEIILSGGSDEKTLSDAYGIYKMEYPNEELKTIRFIRPEFVFDENIISKLFGEYELHKQFCVGSYKVDWYVPELNLVIEFDEKHHNKNSKIDLKRQQYIESKLKCKFLRYKY